MVHETPGCADTEPSLRTVEDTLDIDGKYIVPALRLREIVERGTPGDPGVIYEDVQLRFTLSELGYEGVNAGLRLFRETRE